MQLSNLYKCGVCNINKHWEFEWLESDRDWLKTRVIRLATCLHVCKCTCVYMNKYLRCIIISLCTRKRFCTDALYAIYSVIPRPCSQHFHAEHAAKIGDQTSGIIHTWTCASSWWRVFIVDPQYININVMCARMYNVMVCIYVFVHEWKWALTIFNAIVVFSTNQYCRICWHKPWFLLLGGWRVWPPLLEQY